MFQELTVDLRLPPGARWQLSQVQRQQARELFSLYKADLSLSPNAGEFLVSSVREFVRDEYWQEMESLSRQVGLSASDVALCNFY